MPISDLPDRPGWAGQGQAHGEQFHLDGETAVIATMHGKEAAIGPVLAQGLGLHCLVPAEFDTDRFGTFTREIERAGSPLDAARAKIEAALAGTPSARVAIASEGSFGPHPQVPFAPLAQELVLMVDRRSGLEIAGHDATLETNFAHLLVDRPDGAVAFAGRVGFPGHALIVMGCRGEQPAPDLALWKGITDLDALARAVRRTITVCGKAFVETDMRASFNPTRLKAIERAAWDLVRRFQSRCPACAYPGFSVAERVRGLPCEDCGEPTEAIKAEISVCAACGHRLDKAAPGSIWADSGLCPACNP